MSRRERMTKLLFRSALVELMQEKPLNKITIKELCQRADLNRTTFYLHYSDQQDLLNDVAEDFVEKTVNYLKKEKIAPGGDYMTAGYLRYVKDNAAVCRTLMCGVAGDEIRAKIIGRIYKEMSYMWPVIEEAGQNEYLYAFMLEGSASVVAQWLEGGFDLPEEELAGLLNRMCKKLTNEIVDS